MGATFGSRRWWRAGVTAALGLGMTLLGATAAAAESAPPKDGFVVRAGGLVLTHNGQRYEGSLKVSIRNLSSTTVFGDFEIEIPAGLTVITLDGASACFGSRAHWSCGMNSAMGPGELRTVTVYFGSFAAGERYARITAPGKVTAAPSGTTTRNAWESDDYAGILRSTTGSVRHPRPYQPSTVPDLALTAGSTVVTRDDTGTYLVRVPLTVQDRNDAFNIGAYLRIDAPEGHGFPHVEPTAICIGVCDVWGGWMASGESRDLAVLFTMPSGTAPGSYQVTVTGTMNENNGTPADVTPENNAVTASFTIPA